MGSVVDALSGPPKASRYGTSKSYAVQIIRSSAATTRTGMIHGSVTWRNAANLPAPAIDAASYSSGETVWSLARMTMTMNGMYFHEFTTTRVHRTLAGELRNDTGVLEMPDCCSR